MLVPILNSAFRIWQLADVNDHNDDVLRGRTKSLCRRRAHCCRDVHNGSYSRVRVGGRVVRAEKRRGCALRCRLAVIVQKCDV